MPVSVGRKSSIGGLKRGPQKYIPYRADDLQHGKRTGIAVAYVDRNSDEFEPFDQLLKQADLRTPPKPKMQNKKKRGVKTPIVASEDEDDGEMSMELEDSVPNSPTAYLLNARQITSSIQRVGSSSRRVASHSEVDFDQIPSPRPSSARASGRQSFANGRHSQPRLSQASRAYDQEQSSDDNGGFDLGGYNERDDEEDREETPVPTQRTPRVSARRPSFAAMHFVQHEAEEDPEERLEEADENEEEEMVPTQIVHSSRADKGKSREVEAEATAESGAGAEEEYGEPEDVNEGVDMEVDVDGGMEDEIARGLEDVEMQPEEDENGVVEEEGAQEAPQKGKGKKGKGRKRGKNDSVEKEQRPSKRVRIEAENIDGEGRKRARGRPRKENQVLTEVVHDQNVEDDNGLRRGLRMRYKPLEWWRCEKVVYGRRDSGQCLVPTIKEIRRLPKEETEPLGAKHRRPQRGRSKSATVDANLDYDPEEGWDDTTEPDGVVIDYDTKKEMTRRVAITAKMLRPKQAANADFSFQKVFGDSDFMAAGQLVIPPKGQKPTKSTKDNTFIFYLIEGAVAFTVHRTSYVLTTGSMFLVPRGNMYYIRNISNRDAKLFFAQARKLPASETGSQSEGSRSPTRQRSTS